MMKTINFQGDLSGMTAETKPLIGVSVMLGLHVTFPVQGGVGVTHSHAHRGH